MVDFQLKCDEFAALNECLKKEHTERLDKRIIHPIEEGVPLTAITFHENDLQITRKRERENYLVI